MVGQGRCGRVGGVSALGDAHNVNWSYGMSYRYVDKVRQMVSVGESRGEALIVGGGPAGLSAACVLASRGWRRVIVLERVRCPLDYQCIYLPQDSNIENLQRAWTSMFGFLMHGPRTQSSMMLSMQNPSSLHPLTDSCPRCITRTSLVATSTP